MQFNFSAFLELLLANVSEYISQFSRVNFANLKIKKKATGR